VTAAERIEAVLFDYGDTLFHPPDAARVIVEAARDRGVRISREEAHALWEELWRASKTPEEVGTDRDLSPERHRAVWMRLFARAEARVPGVSARLYDEVMRPEHWLVYEDARSTLAELRRRGLRVGVVSNHAYDLRGVFAEHALAEFIDVYVLSFEKGVAKPSPRLFAIAAAEIGVPAARILMVGDHPDADGAAAAAAGLQTFILPEWSGSGPRGLARVLELVDRSRR
jgi:putative hydrolase of the HAD superfamily